MLGYLVHGKNLDLKGVNNMEPVSTTLAVTAVTKMAVKEIVKKAATEITKEIVKSGFSEVVKKGGVDVGSMFNSRNLEYVNKAIRLSRTSQMVRSKIHRNGPEDVSFDTNKGLGLGKEYAESEFTKGTERVQGRKPTPDGVTVTPKGEKIYWEDKRPSECNNNSWLSTYKNDPLKDYRVQQAEAVKNGEITKARGEARMIIKEHDEHMKQKGGRWNDPKEVSANAKEKLGIRMPSNQTERINEIIAELKETGRNPEVIEKDGITAIVYDCLK